jgi:deoxyribodipyrimidine photolyase
MPKRLRTIKGATKGVIKGATKGATKGSTKGTAKGAAKGANVGIFIFTRDLRIYDNPALNYALENSDRVILLYIIDEADITANPVLNWNNATNGTWHFLMECILDLVSDCSRTLSATLHIVYKPIVQAIKFIITQCQLLPDINLDETISDNPLSMKSANYTIYITNDGFHSVSNYVTQLGFKIVEIKSEFLNSKDLEEPPINTKLAKCLTHSAFIDYLVYANENITKTIVPVTAMSVNPLLKNKILSLWPHSATCATNIEKLISATGSATGATNIEKLISATCSATGSAIGATNIEKLISATGSTTGTTNVFQLSQVFGKIFFTPKPIFPKKMHRIHGGRTAALLLLKPPMCEDRFNDFCQIEETLLDSHMTVNSITKSNLSPHITFGTVSSREVWFKIKCDRLLVERTQKSIIFNHLCKHEYIKLISNQLVKQLNLRSQAHPPKELQTGIPFIDASIRQIYTTRTLSAASRLVLANFMISDLHMQSSAILNYFSLLSDFCPLASIANILTLHFASQRKNFIPTNPWLAAEKYDPNEIFIKRWLPEFKQLPNHYSFAWYRLHKRYKDDQLKQMGICRPFDHYAAISKDVKK